METQSQPKIASVDANPTQSPVIIIDDLPTLGQDYLQPCAADFEAFTTWDLPQQADPMNQLAPTITGSSDMLVALLHQRVVNLEQILFGQFRSDSIASRLNALEFDSHNALDRITSVEKRQDRNAERVGDLAKWQHQVAAMNGIQIANVVDTKQSFPCDGSHSK